MSIFKKWFREVILGKVDKKKSEKISSVSGGSDNGTSKRKATTKIRKKKLSAKKVRKKRVVGKVAKKKTGSTRKDKSSLVTKFVGNPILEPSEKNRWESKAAFNPAALHAEGKVHLLYRAIGDGDISVLGYVASDDGFSISKKSNEPVYFSATTYKDRIRSQLETSPISYISGGGGEGGCEDPRLSLIDDRLYLTYTAFDGWGSLRMALSSISLKDFLKKKWNWKKPVLISPPGEIHKNWVLFPEKIDGKFAILHSISPEILVDYFDSLDFEEGQYIESHYSGRVKTRKRWDDWVRGAGPPPIKTKKGWLLLYHAMDTSDPDRYKIGAMLLDLKNPQKIIARSKRPILEPDEQYENEGWKEGVAYCCGAVVKDGKLLMYYGGADKFSCVASVDLENFIKELIETGRPKIRKRKVRKIRKVKNQKK